MKAVAVYPGQANSIHLEEIPAPSLDDVTDPRGRMFRAFADRTRSDRHALAACISTSRQELTEAEVGQIAIIGADYAAIVDAQLRTRVDVRPSESQGAPFRVLVGANMPAVLVELGFLSNPNEEQKLASASFQETLVQALFQSIVGFRVRVEQPIRPEADNAFWEEP